jgi:hypothetical protein
MPLRLSALRDAHKRWMRARCAGDLCVWILASDRAQVRFEIVKAHRCELLALGWFAHWFASIASSFMSAFFMRVTAG